jgi:LPXTG-site transpeptidase (sortase) family protein
MYSRHRRTPLLPRLLAGIAIVIVVVVAFGLYQQFGQPRSQQVIPTSTKVVINNDPVGATKAAIMPTASPTPSEQLTIISELASLNAPIRELYFGADDNWDVAPLGEYAGHLEGTRLIGQGGNFVLAGHVELKDGRPGPFAGIKALKPGDQVLVRKAIGTSTTVITYIVTKVFKVKPDEISVIRNHGYEELTLITCDGWDDRTGLYTERVVVHARPNDPNLGASTGAIGPIGPIGAVPTMTK